MQNNNNKQNLIDYLNILPEEVLKALVDISTIFTDEQIIKLKDFLKETQIRNFVINFINSKNIKS